MAENKDKAQNGKQQGDTMPDQGGIPSSPEANVFPAGAAQTSHGSADGRAVPGGTPAGTPGDSAAGTPDEGRLGGAGGTSASGTTGNDPDR